MTNILFRLSNLEIKNKKIIEEKDKSVQNLQGALEKEQKLKAKLQDRNSENSQILLYTSYSIKVDCNSMWVDVC
jgi:hypothetical protein